jgi:hypothetical protein
MVMVIKCSEKFNFKGFRLIKVEMEKDWGKMLQNNLCFFVKSKLMAFHLFFLSQTSVCRTFSIRKWKSGEIFFFGGKSFSSSFVGMY